MTFEQAMNHILRWEGGYSYDIRDPGGETSFGISKRAYPKINIELLSKEEAHDIYKKDYWEKIKCDELPNCLKLIVFSSAVNQGPGFAVKTLQKIVEVKVDGRIGPKTIEAIKAVNPLAIKKDFLKIQAEHYFSLNKSEFIKGWILRLIDLSQY